MAEAPTALATAPQNASGLATTTLAARWSGACHVPQGSTSTWAHSRSASHSATTFDAQGRPRRTTTSGRHLRTSPARNKASAVLTVPSTRQPLTASASTGHPVARARADTASGLPAPAPATTSPRSPAPATVRAVSSPMTCSAGATTWCQGAPSGRPPARRSNAGLRRAAASLVPPPGCEPVLGRAPNPAGGAVPPAGCEPVRWLAPNRAGRPVPPAG